MTTDELPIIRGRYEPIELLGEGAFARTVRARDRETGDEVAVKVMHPSRMASLGDFERFEREARALATLAHVAIPRYRDQFTWRHEGQDLYCLVQDFRAGAPLDALIARRDRFDEAAIVALGTALVGVLDYLARRDPPVVHRDIKPANILLDERGQPSLVDFGGVREAVRQTIQAGSTVIGTFGYMPPEQLIGQATPASDIFSVGVTLVCALTGRDAASLSSDGFSIPIDQLALNVSPGLRQVLATMVAPRLDERYTEPSLVLDDLRAVAAGAPPRHTEAQARRAAARRAREQREAKRRLSRGVSGVYRALAALLALLFVGAAFAAREYVGRGTFDALLAILAALSLTGFVLTFRGVIRRYAQHTWDPPPPTWREVVAEVIDYGRAEAPQQELMQAELAFDVGGLRQTVKAVRTANVINARFPVGSRHRLLVSPDEPNHFLVEQSPADAAMPPRRNR